MLGLRWRGGDDIVRMLSAANISFHSSSVRRMKLGKKTPSEKISGVVSFGEVMRRRSYGVARSSSGAPL
jgi:hypothetical protein